MRGGRRSRRARILYNMDHGTLVGTYTDRHDINTSRSSRPRWSEIKKKNCNALHYSALHMRRSDCHGYNLTFCRDTYSQNM